ncbi:class I SAM-dependent methyltransferase, partial [Ursidibacter sp. B-7004-1]
YVFQTDWFSHNIPSLDIIFDQLKPTRILEIGSFEGRSTLHFMEKMSEYAETIEIYCIDSWEGGLEHKENWNMDTVEQVFEHNMHLAIQQYPRTTLFKCKGYSHPKMMELLVEGKKGYFDFVYVDGSHEAPDVLLDALLAHQLVRVGGVIAFDDYLWSPKSWNEADHYLLVKPAVDSYVNTYQRKVSVIQSLPTYQLYVVKISE